MQDRRHYTREFKQGAVDLCLKQGYSYGKAAQELGMSVKTLGNWVREARHAAAPPAGLAVAADQSDDPTMLRAQIRELQKRLARSEMEKEILKKATAYFAQESL